MNGPCLLWRRHLQGQPAPRRPGVHRRGRRRAQAGQGQVVTKRQRAKVSDGQLSGSTHTGHGAWTRVASPSQRSRSQLWTRGRGRRHARVAALPSVHRCRSEKSLYSLECVCLKDRALEFSLKVSCTHSSFSRGDERFTLKLYRPRARLSRLRTAYVAARRPRTHTLFFGLAHTPPRQVTPPQPEPRVARPAGAH